MRTKPSLDGVTSNGLTAVFHRCGPLGRTLAGALQAGEYAVLQSAAAHPEQYSNAYEFSRAYLAANLARKLDCLPTGIDRRAVAMTKWFESEAVCRSVNRSGRLVSLIDRSSEYAVTDVIALAKKLIKDCLGDLDLNEMYSCSTFSGGASTRLTRRSGHPFYKLQGRPHVTRKAALLAACYVWHDEPWRRHFLATFGHDTTPAEWLEVVEGARFDTVPKDSKTDRTILIEPDMNMLIQKGLGKIIRRRLRKRGINLNSQLENQNLARIGSRTGSLATIDLSSASDSISTWLVRELLPADWFDVLDMTRSETAIVDGKPHLLEKFSSMGNGFTFELESLIFWALTKASISVSGSADPRIGIYGDDIICHHSVVPLLRDVFLVVGFTINSEKSYWSGPFRESCGSHYFYGSDVTPFYCKHSLMAVEQRLWMANSWRAWCNRTGYPGQRAYEQLVELIDHKYRNPVPESYGLKSGLNCTWSEASPRYLRKRQQFFVRPLVPTRKRHGPNGWPALYTTLWSYQGPERPDTSFVIEKGDVDYRLKRASTSQWDCSYGTVFLPSHLNRNFG